MVSQVLVGVADQAIRRGYPTVAARLLAASEGISGGPDLSRPDSAQVEAAARTALGDPQFADADQAGAQGVRRRPTRARDHRSGARAHCVRAELVANMLSARGGRLNRCLAHR